MRAQYLYIALQSRSRLLKQTPSYQHSTLHTHSRPPLLTPLHPTPHPHPIILPPTPPSPPPLHPTFYHLPTPTPYHISTTAPPSPPPLFIPTPPSYTHSSFPDLAMRGQNLHLALFKSRSRLQKQTPSYQHSTLSIPTPPLLLTTAPPHSSYPLHHPTPNSTLSTPTSPLLLTTAPPSYTHFSFPDLAMRGQYLHFALFKSR